MTLCAEFSRSMKRKWIVSVRMSHRRKTLLLSRLECCLRTEEFMALFAHCVTIEILRCVLVVHLSRPRNLTKIYLAHSRKFVSQSQVMNQPICVSARQNLSITISIHEAIFESSAHLGCAPATTDNLAALSSDFSMNKRAATCISSYARNSFSFDFRRRFHFVGSLKHKLQSDQLSATFFRYYF